MKIISFLFFFFSWNFFFSQVSLNTIWEKFEPSLISNGNSEAWAIGTNSAGEIFWGVNKDMPGIFQYMDALLFKLDVNGNQIWVDTGYAKLFAQQSYNLKVTDSNIYVGGRTCRALGIDSCDALLFNTSSVTGDTDTNFIYDAGFGYEEIDGISLDTSGIFLTGWTKGSSSEMNALLIKIDYSGNIIWQNTFSSPGAKDDHQDGHIVVDDSVIYLCGLYNGSPLLGWEGKSLLAKFDKTTGNLLDSVTFGRSDVWTNAENALGMSTDGTYLYLTGYTTSSLNNWDIFVAKFDKNLNQKWLKTWGGPSTESARAITVNDGIIYIGGNTESYGQGGVDMALVKFDTAGNFIEYNLWGDSLDDQILDLYMDGTKLYITGRSNSYNTSNDHEAVLLKIETNPTSSVFNINKDFKIYPNPFNQKITLNNSSLHKKYNIMIYDVLGKCVFSRYNCINKSQNIMLGGLKKGSYFMKIFNYDYSLNESMIIKKM